MGTADQTYDHAAGHRHATSEEATECFRAASLAEPVQRSVQERPQPDPATLSVTQGGIGRSTKEFRVAQERPPIDVERLTQAYRLVMGWDAPASWMEEVADEYARLAGGSVEGEAPSPVQSDD